MTHAAFAFIQRTDLDLGLVCFHWAGEQTETQTYTRMGTTYGRVRVLGVDVGVVDPVGLDGGLGEGPHVGFVDIV